MIRAMPALALVVCTLPSNRASVRAARALLPELAGSDGVVIFCPEPYQAPAAWERSHKLLPLADLPHERSKGTVGAPVYLCDGGAGEEAFDRYFDEVPGVRIDANRSPTAADVRAAAASVRTEPAVKPVRGTETVEAVVLAYRSKDYIAPCLDSLLAQDWPGLKVTVLDNASGDGTADFVRKHYPTFEVIESKQNLGFAAGHNLLFERSKADYLVLLNHDAVARRNFVSELVYAARKHPEGATFGGKMLMRRCPTILNSTGIVITESGFAADRDIGRPDRSPSFAIERVFGTCGGALMLRNKVVREIGGFDASFFMYFEDVDWCWRARLAGHEVYYVPSATAVHDWHGDLATAAGPKTSESEETLAEREGRRRMLCERNRLQSLTKNYSLYNVVRSWRGLKKHDRARIQSLEDHIARGGGPLPKRVLQAIRDSHAWVLRNLPGLLWRRFRTQRLRRVKDAEITGFFEKGFHEMVGVGDLHAIHDRYCAKPRSVIRMGDDDQGSLGPGWHHAEPGHRWSMGECWFYLQSDRPWRTVRVTIAPRPLPSFAELSVDGIPRGRIEIEPGKPYELRWEVSEGVPAGQLAECHVTCKPFVPKDEGMGPDGRVLGLLVSAMAAE